MGLSTRCHAWALALTALATNVLADPITSCLQGPNDVCFTWAVPEASVKAGKGDVFFQIQAPTSYQWIGLGIGPTMAQSSIFLIYQDGKGNVTLSTRPGKDHEMPTYKARSDVKLLAGSGVSQSGASSGGMMTANIKCGACNQLVLGGSNNWIAAWRAGKPLDETDPAAMIDQHDDHRQFSVDFSQASVSADSNPFVATASSSSSSSSGSSDDDHNGKDGGRNDDGKGEGGGGAEAVTSLNGSGPSLETLRAAHGLLMSIVFAVLYPLGAILMPLLGKWYFHATWQFVAFIAMWAGFAIGYVTAHRQQIFFDFTHTRLGVFVVCLISLQPILGLVHHYTFQKTQSRSVWSHLHIWYGRALMLLGIVNGGIGLRDKASDLTGNDRRRFVVAFSVVAGVVGALYVAGALYGTWKRGKKKNAQSRSAKREVSSPVAPPRYD